MANRFVNIFLLPIFGCSLVVSSLAQAPRLEVISSDQGLSQGMIYDMLQDRTGFLWFGTRDGLNRYDGYGFRVYKNDPFDRFSISDNIIKALFEDHLGRIWIGTESNGLDVLDPITGRFYHLNKGPKGLPDQNVNAFAETPDGTIWVGTQNGLCRVQLPADLPVHNPDLSTVVVTEHLFWEQDDGNPLHANVFLDFLLADDGILWVGTGKDAYQFNPVTGVKTLLPVQESLDSKVRQKANYFTRGPDGSVWLGQFNRVIHCTNTGFDIFPLPRAKENYTAFLTFDQEGNLFVSRRKEIMFCAKSDLSRPSPLLQVFYKFPDKDIIGSTRILCDKSGLIWIGTNGYGIRKYNPVNRLFHHYLPGVSARKIAPDLEGRLWVWMIPSMFFLLDEADNQVLKPVLDDKSVYQHACLFTHDSNVWLLTEPKDGSSDKAVLVRKNLTTGRQEKLETGIATSMFGLLLEDRRGGIWMTGANNDLMVLDPNTKKQRRFDLSALTGFKENAMVLKEDINGHLWIGTPHGLIRGIPNDQDNGLDFTLFQNNPADINSLNNNSILTVQDDVRDPGQFLWVGTRGGGLNLLNKSTGACRHFTVANGLPNDVIYGILIDENGCLWISTNSGMSKLNPQNDHFENYSVADGLQDNEFNTASFAKTKDGRMVFGGVNGFTLFDPKHINPLSAAPNVLVTALKVQNKIAVPGDGILTEIIEKTQKVTLQYEQNHFTLEFAALDFSTPHKNQFRYRLLGADNHWSEATTQHSTTFSNLPSGTYTFEVQTGGSHGMWSGAPAKLEITILAPWWRSKLAYLLYVLLVVWLCWEAYRIQVRRIQLQEQIAFEHRESERIKAIEQMKTNFFSNITHELRTPVTLILEPLRQILNNPSAENWLPKVSLAEANSRKLLQLVNQLLDLAKLEGGAMQAEYSRGQVTDLLHQVAEPFAEKAQSKGVVLEVGTSSPVIDPFDFDADKLEKIVTNLLSNALKFTGKGGKVTLSWYIAPEDWFVLQVADSGSGIATGDLPRVFDRFYSKADNQQQAQTSTGIGLALCRELAELMKGRMEVESEQGIGSRFTLWLPMLLVHDNNNKDNKPVPVMAATIWPTDESVGAPAGASAETTQAISARPMLLLAEDNPELRNFIAETLADKFEVVEAADGQEAVTVALERMPDIIVSDWMMPQLDGIGMLDVLKNDVRTSHIPVLMLTAKTGLESRVTGLQHGADAYLGKPFQTEELLAWIENLLESRKRLQLNYTQSPQQTHGTLAHQTETSTTGPSASEATLGVLDRQFLERFKEIAEKEIENDRITPEDLARQMAMSRSQLHRKLSALTGLSATEYMRNYRLDRAHELLKAGAGNVSEVAWRVGFVNAKHFSTSFKERFGKSPSEV